MRQIFFKAKRKDNGEWVEGSYVYTFNEDKVCPVVGVMKENHWIVEKDSNIVLIDKDTICQYTGLTDKNGNKIWENDIVKCVDKNSESEFVAVVEFGNPNGFYSWGYQLKHIKGDEPNLDILLWIDMDETGATCEVIGNIFDNPELIGE